MLAIQDYFADTQNANEFIDAVLTAIKASYGPNIDPFHLPDETLNFHQKVLIVDIKGNYIL